MRAMQGYGKLPISYTTDVVVVGAGVSGVAAAVASSRAGARTLLVERCAFPGGTSTSGLMSTITNFYVTRRNQQVVRGIAQEVLDRLAAKGGAPRGPFTREIPQIPNDPEKMKLILIEMLEDAGVKVLYRSSVCGARVARRSLRAAVVQNKAGHSAVRAKVFVDATGDADLAFMAGAEVEAVPANGSLELRMGNVDLDRVVEYFLRSPSEYDEYGDVETNLADFERNWKERGIIHVPHGNGRRMSVVQKAIAEGRYPRELGLVHGLDAFGMYGLRGTGTLIVNTGFVNGNLLDPFFLSEAESDARKAASVAARFLIENMPGFENAYLAETAPELGIRVTRRIRGRHTLTQAEREGFHRFPDVVAVATERKIGGPRYEGAFDVPYGILLPLGVEDLLVASGKAVSTDPPAAIRGQVACMQLGQACGVAAAVCVRSAAHPSEVSVRDVQTELLRQGVYLGDQKRLEELGLS